MACFGRRRCGARVLFACCVALLSLLSLARAKSVPSDYAEVYVVPHSHCDPGWKLTYTAYLEGSVRTILTSVVDALSKDPSRRFVWSEISFFRPWYMALAEDRRAAVRTLVADGRLEFVGGGYVQHDEAVATADAAIASLQEGWAFLRREFGVSPRVAWQIDPFGHGSFTQELAVRLGLSAVVLNRVDLYTKWRLSGEGGMIFDWASAFGDESVVAHVLHGHYSNPPYLDFERDGDLTDDTLPQAAESLVQTARAQRGSYATKPVLLLFGDDFRHADAERTLSNMERLLAYVNENAETYRVTARLASASEYFDAVMADVKERDVQLPTHSGDFFPYADWIDGYWSGFYATRPNLKLKMREAEAALRSAEQSLVLLHAETPQLSLRHAVGAAQWASTFASGCTKFHAPAFECEDAARLAQGGPEAVDTARFVRLLQHGVSVARRAVLLVAHHDGVTGTSLAPVVRDYELRLEWAADTLSGAAAFALGAVLSKGANEDLESAPLAALPPQPASIRRSASRREAQAAAELFEGGSSHGQCQSVVFQNTLAWPRAEVVRVPVAEGVRGNALLVLSTDGDKLRSQLVPPLEGVSAHTTLVFRARMPALGAASYLVCVEQQGRFPELSTASKITVYADDSSSASAEALSSFSGTASRFNNGDVRVSFDGRGLPASVRQGRLSATNMTLSLVEYMADFPGATSGAYKMRLDFGIASVLGFLFGLFVCALSVPVAFTLSRMRVSLFELPTVRRRMHPTTFNIVLMLTMGAGCLAGAYLATHGTRRPTRAQFALASLVACGGCAWPIVLSRWVDGHRRILLVLSFVLYAAVVFPASKLFLQDHMAGEVRGAGVHSIAVIDGPVLAGICARFQGGHSVVTWVPRDGLPMSALAGVGGGASLSGLSGALDVHVTGLSARMNADVAVRLDTSVRSQSLFLTDRGGFGLGSMQRETQRLRLLPGNFYPATHMAGIVSGAEAPSGTARPNDAVFVLTRRAVGVSSLRNGRVEVVVHRRSELDDGCGLMQGADDEDAIDVSLRIATIARRDAQAAKRALDVAREALALNFPPVVYQWAPKGWDQARWDAARRRAWVTPLQGGGRIAEDVHVQHMSLAVDVASSQGASDRPRVFVRLQRLLSARSVDRPPSLSDTAGLKAAASGVVGGLRLTQRTDVSFLGTAPLSDAQSGAALRDGRWLAFCADLADAPAPFLSQSSESEQFAGVDSTPPADKAEDDGAPDASSGIGHAWWLLMAAPFVGAAVVVGRRIRGSADRKPHLG